MAIRFIVLAILVTLACSSLGQTEADQNIFQDVERGHWAYAELHTLFEEGVGPGYREPGHFFSKSYFMRYELAIIIDGCLQEVGLRAYQKWNRNAARHALTPQIAFSLLRLVTGFPKELSFRGVDVPAVSKRLVAVAGRMESPPGHPFDDVPTTHWAFSVVESLRAKGIMRGYPDGTFNGH